MGEHGQSGSEVHVNLLIDALDSHSFSDTCRRNSRAIVELVANAIKNNVDLRM